MSILTNNYQTQLTDEFLDTLNSEIRDELIDLCTNIEFVKRLISPDRKRAKDLERDYRGRIVVDLSNPHILENMDYFREAAINHQRNGVYTNLMPNTNPQSEYGKWLIREIDRCWNGMVRPEDGEWIPGTMYFYLNYLPIIQTKIRVGSKVGDRVVDFPEVWEGVYWRFHYHDQARNGGLYDNFIGGKHSVEIAARGKSKSYSAAAELVRQFLLGESPLSNKQCKALVTAYQKEFLIRDGVLNKFLDGINFCAEHTQFPRARLKDSMSDMQWTSGYLDKETNIPKGSNNEVTGIAVKDDPDKVRGKRSQLLIYEEFGCYPKFLDVWQMAFPNVQEGEYAFGIAEAYGTGGSEGSDFTGALEMINYPDGYFVYSVPNVYDKGSIGNKRTIFFFPSYINSKGYYNHDGVSDVTGALIAELERRYTLKYNSSDPIQLTHRKAEYAFTLQDAIMRRDTNIFPSDQLNDRIMELDNNTKSLSDMYIGKFGLDKSGTVIFVPAPSCKPIMDYPHKDNKLMGAVHINKMPVKDSSGKIPWGRYIAGIDPYDDDASHTMSLGAIYVLDLYTDEIVCEYVGRPMFAEDFYEICRRMLLFYNAEANYENNKKGLFSYFSKYNSLFLLSDTLEYLKDKNLIKGEALYGNKAKGTIASQPIQKYGRSLIRDWLLKPFNTTIIVKSEDNKEIESSVTINNINRCYYRALMKELAMWNADSNFDRYDALLMTLLLREDRLIKCGVQSPSEIYKEIDSSYKGNDTFFNDGFEYKKFLLKRVIE